MALSRGLARSGRILRAACEAGRGPEHRHLRGLDVTADQYPYTRAATALDASIPSWAESGGWDSLLARLRDPATRAQLRDEMVNPKVTESFYYEAGGADGVLITGTFQDSLRYL